MGTLEAVVRLLGRQFATHVILARTVTGAGAAARELRSRAVGEG